MSYTGRIAVARSFGPPEVITIEEHDYPEPGPGQVLVAVRTGGLNPVDAQRRAGVYGGPTPLLLGVEFAGVVLASASQDYRRGDEVIGWLVSGADADLVLTDPARLRLKPADIGWDLAGGLSGVGQTALTALNALDLPAGDTVVVHGAAGGVGTVLVQLAVARGLHVIGTASAANQEYVRGLGAVPVVYGQALDRALAAAAGERTVTASIDLAGSPEAGRYAAAVRSAGGQAITLVPSTVPYGIPLVQARYLTEQMDELLARVADGSLVLPVEAIPFPRISDAHRRFDAKRARGKTVLDLADNPHLARARA
ncbi:NADP-dependent oxidoreductase [Streptomyces sp. NPDC004134]|uniref:NADP-dependent oxidoreductase n=1 Tax=Streptomyces sp. NPDC004134 TaxID=3364691 RepID=UPI00367422C0